MDSRTSERHSFILHHILYKVTTKQDTIAPVRYSRENMFALHTQSFFWNVPYKRAHTNEETSPSRSWKKNSSVCKYTLFYFLSVVLHANLRLGWLFVEVPRSHIVGHTHTHTNTHTHTLGRTPLIESSARKEAATYTTRSKQKSHIPRIQFGFDPSTTGNNPLEI